MVPNIHSTDTLTSLIASLNLCIWGVKSASLNGTCKWIPRGYAGSPYKHKGSPLAQATLWSSLSILDSCSILLSCLRPSKGSDKLAISLLARYNNALEFYSVYTLMAIVNSSLIILRPRYSTKRPINKAEAVLERSTSVVDDLCIALQDLRKKNGWFQDSRR